MGYGIKTSKLRLTSPSFGELISPTDERRNAQIVENQLFGAIRMHSGGHGIIRNGRLILVSGPGGNYKVIMYEDKATGKPSIECFINQIYCFTEESLEFTNLSDDTTYYLYVQLTEDSPTTSSSRINKQVKTGANTTGVIPSDALLVAIVIINEPGSTVFIENPVGRIDLPTIGNHIMDNQNPHTPLLLQDNIVTSGLDVLNYLHYTTLIADQFIISGNSIISGNITTLGNLIISGNHIVHGDVHYNRLLIEDLVIPGSFTTATAVIQSGIDVYGTSMFRNHINLTSGITIDGFDPSAASGLLDGSNADALHGHILGSISPGVKLIPLSPQFMNTIVSGEPASSTDGYFYTARLFDRNLYQYWAPDGGESVKLVTRLTLPSDFESIDRIKVTHGVGYLESGVNLTISVLDKDLTESTITNGKLASQTLTTSDVTVSGGQLLPGQVMNLISRFNGSSGVSVMQGDTEVWYRPKNGETLVFDWNKANAESIEEGFDGLRVAPCDLRIQKVLASDSIALSGSTVFDIGVSNAGSVPVSIFTSGTTKPTLSFGDTGASFVTVSQAITENTLISAGQIINTSLDQVASGSKTINLQLVTYRL